MTVVVSFLCSDGMVVAADSMITPSMGNLHVGHHTGVKVHLIPGPQVFAFSGDQGQAARFRFIAENNASAIISFPHALLYPLFLSQNIQVQLQSTGIAYGSSNLNSVIGFLHGNRCYSCVFEGAIQPRLLDSDHYYVALGSGKLSADPFLRFVTDIFCQTGQPPKVSLATFLAIWTVQHVIDVNPGGVAGPIRAAVIEQSPGGYNARELPSAEIDLHVQAKDDAAQALRDWRRAIQAGTLPGAGAPPSLGAGSPP